ncbi:MAG: hypothetical protein HC819_01940 [Cyclobacteriaceae bacterium]|nr:hypothetical protein [Cyclobacteriaceae bacterium]
MLHVVTHKYEAIPKSVLEYGLSLLCLLYGIAGKAQQQGLFDTDEVLDVTLTTDIKNLLKTKKEGEYQPAGFLMEGKTYEIKVKARGNYRRENCEFPPITLNFAKADFEHNSYMQLDKLKLVNTCNMQKSYEQYILSEYLVYRAFNLLSDKSFKVRLLRISYVDSHDKIKTVTRYGFVIEDQYMLAQRLGGMMIQTEGIRDRSTNKRQIVMLSIFQFMIGNTDWSIPRLHNVKLLKINQVNEPAPYVIPYDFDYTGMVDASYATPSPILGISSLRERLFWGKCYTEGELKMAIEEFKDKKKEFYQLYEDCELLDKSNLLASLDFWTVFIRSSKTKKSWKRYFIDQCKE